MRSLCSRFVRIVLILILLSAGTSATTSIDQYNNKQFIGGTAALLNLPTNVAADKAEQWTGSRIQQLDAVTQHSKHRQLPESFDSFDIADAFDKLISTPIEEWGSAQWILVAIMALLAFWCCGCMTCNRRRNYGGGGGFNGGPYGAGGYGGYGPYGGGGYRQQQSGGGSGFCGCVRNLLLCFCCYELCCADCRDVPCFRHSSWSGNAGHDVYRIHDGDIV